MQYLVNDNKYSRDAGGKRTFELSVMSNERMSGEYANGNEWLSNIMHFYTTLYYSLLFFTLGHPNLVTIRDKNFKDFDESDL